MAPGSARSPGEGNGNPLQYTCPENPMERRLVGYSPWGHRVGHDLVTKQQQKGENYRLQAAQIYILLLMVESSTFLT